MTSLPSLSITGLNGMNPLGFLAALGTLRTARQFSANVRLRWERSSAAWRPILVDTVPDPEKFLGALEQTLKTLSLEPFKLEKRLPFDAKVYREHALIAQRKATAHEQRLADFVTALGSEALTDRNGNFQDTLLRMVRRGDSAGQGFLYYALQTCITTNKDHLRRALFRPWDYSDDSFSFRWDPIEDQRYAMRWDDPSKNKLGTIQGANRMALEALPLLPVIPRRAGLATTAFSVNGQQQTCFTWPVWEEPLVEDVIRSLLTLNELQADRIDRRLLGARGVVDVFRSIRFAPNQYYKNLSPAELV